MKQLMPKGDKKILFISNDKNKDNNINDTQLTNYKVQRNNVNIKNAE